MPGGGRISLHASNSSVTNAPECTTGTLHSVTSNCRCRYHRRSDDGTSSDPESPRPDDYWRTRRALTQGELAQLVGVNISTVARLERGATARLATVRKLAQVLKVEPGNLMDPPPAV